MMSPPSGPNSRNALAMTTGFRGMLQEGADRGEGRLQVPEIALRRPSLSPPSNAATIALMSSSRGPSGTFESSEAAVGPHASRVNVATPTALAIFKGGRSFPVGGGDDDGIPASR